MGTVLTGFAKIPCLLDLDRYDAIQDGEGACNNVRKRPRQDARSHTKNAKHNVELAQVENRHLSVGLDEKAKRKMNIGTLAMLKREEVGCIHLLTKFAPVPIRVTMTDRRDRQETEGDAQENK